MSDLSINKSAVITEIDSDLCIAERLADMGFIEGARITAAFSGPFGDPVAYRVNNTVIAIRKSDCLLIIVEENPYEDNRR